MTNIRFRELLEWVDRYRNEQRPKHARNFLAVYEGAVRDKSMMPSSIAGLTRHMNLPKQSTTKICDVV